MKTATISLVLLLPLLLFGKNPADGPIVPDGFKVSAFASEPLVRNPAALTFDSKGRLYVGQGPQWRSPKPETPGDHVDLLIDLNKDGVADKSIRFAEGFNSIQGLVWWGDALWIANAPDFTKVRDTDGDDVADEYTRVYTGLGNLEHCLHGLNIGPDNKLYMSKGNSKGYNLNGHLAPKAFRELWGLQSPKGAPDYPTPITSDASNYKRNYHTPQDDWGQQGGVLRCDATGRNLEIVSRGCRNPWDITFDDGFNWLGTDNDQTSGDRVIMPFYGAHFGWGHEWSHHWTGENHLPTVPISGPLFEGSGAGIIHYHAKQFPEKWHGVYFICDWLKREVYALRPSWKGALMTAKDNALPVFAHAGGGRSMPSSQGRLFDPTDIEVGPEGALYIASWGREYGATFQKETQSNQGRIYRITHESHHSISLPEGTDIPSLLQRLSHHLPAVRTSAQNDLIQHGPAAVKALTKALVQEQLNTTQETWFTWTLARIPNHEETSAKLLRGFLREPDTSLNLKIQSMRSLAHMRREDRIQKPLPKEVLNHLASAEARMRFEAVQALWQSNDKSQNAILINLASTEKERIVYHALWKSWRDLLTIEERKELLMHAKNRVRLASMLGLLEDNRLTPKEVQKLTEDSASEIRQLAISWLEKTGNAAEPHIHFTPSPGTFHSPIKVTLSARDPGVEIRYTLTGDTPVNTSLKYMGPITITKPTTIRAITVKGRLQQGSVLNAEYQIEAKAPFRQREFVSDLQAATGNHYAFDPTGLTHGKRHYTDRTYYVTDVPPELQGVPFIQTANQDDRTIRDTILSFRVDQPVTLYLGLDRRIRQAPSWMKLGVPNGFQETDLIINTTDPIYRVYKKDYPAGLIQLGSNINHPKEARCGHYLVALDRQLLKPLPKATTVNQALALIPEADPEKGRELFLHDKGAGCFQCHALEGRGNVFAPDLSDIGTRSDAATLLESIIHPSKVITEGFAQQVIETKDDFTYSGIVLSETGHRLSLAQANGQTIKIRKDQIQSRETTHLSTMPDGFATLMTPQQLADLTAYLLKQTSAPISKGFSFQKKANELNLFYDSQQIATYLLDHPKLTRRAFVNVHTPNGIQVIRNFPPKRPEDLDPGYRGEQGIIHPVMHAGLWMGFGWIEGEDYWRLQARVKHAKFIKPPIANGDQASFSVLNHYLNKSGKKIICSETCHFKFTRTPEGITLDWDSSFYSDDHDFRFGDQEESGLAIRVASELRVQGGNGRILNDRGERNGKETWGKPMKWIDYSGVIKDRRAGIRVIPHPDNPRPSWSHSRDYGVVVINPFPKQPKERRQPYITTPVNKGERFRLRYKVILYDIPKNQELE